MLDPIRDAATIDNPRRSRDAAALRADVSPDSAYLSAWLAREAGYHRELLRTIEHAPRPAHGRAPRRVG